MIKLLIDPQIFNDHIFGGISRYYSEIMAELYQQKLADINLPIYITENIHLNEKKLIYHPLKPLNNFCLKHNFFKKKIIRRLKRKNYKKVKKELLTGDYDLFIPTYYNPYFLDFINQKPFVLTVYDMIHEIFPECFNKNDKTSVWKKILIEKATKIIAVSSNTKNDIIKYFPAINPDKIHVIYHGYSALPLSKATIKLPKKYILFVGNRAHYKNFLFFVKAIAPLLKKDKELFVFCAGGAAFNEEELRLFEMLEITNQMIQYRFQDIELAQIYNKALCFVFPSLYEGFGIPVLEAMANECPTILAYHSSFPEVASDAGIYFDLNSYKDLEAKIIKTIYNQDFRQEMIKKGLKNVERFSWKTAAKECLKVYQLAVQNEKN